MEWPPVLEDEYALRAIPAVEHSLGYQFHDRHLLLTALTHRSYCHEIKTASGDFDELEWLGDSVLQLAITSWLFNSARGSRRTSGQLSKTRQRFVDAGACESFAMKLNLFPHLRTGQGQPVQGTKILADCFEAVLGAVYVDAGECSDLEPIHGILARVIPSYERNHGKRPQKQPYVSEQPHHYSHHPLHHHDHLHRDRYAAGYALADPPRPRAGEATKIMNLAHRIKQMAKKGMTASQTEAQSSDGTARGQVSSPILTNVGRSPQEVVREFDELLRSFKQNFLRGGSLSFATKAFAEEFGASVASFFQDVAGDPNRSGLLDDVLAGSCMLRKHFADTPVGAERVVMEVVLVSSEVRLQNFVAVEHLLINVLRQSSDTEHSALMVIRSAPQGAATITLLSEVIAESATSLLFSSRQRAALSTGELPPDSSADSKALEISLDPRLKRPLSSSQSPPPTQPALPVAVVRAGPRPVFPRPMQPAFPVAVVRAAPLPGFPPPFVAPSDGNFGPARGRGFHISSPPRGRSMGVQPHGRGGWGPGKGRPRRGRGRRGGCP